MKIEKKQLSSGFAYFALNGKYFVSGQPAPPDIPLLKREAEITHVINVRGAGEMAALPFKPQELMEEHNIACSSIPLMENGAFLIKNLERISQILFSLKEGERALVHCAAGQRASAAVAGAHVISGAAKKEEAPELAAKLGLQKEDLIQRLLAALEAAAKRT